MDFTWLTRWQPQLLGLLRIVAGLLFIEHATVKLFGFPPGAQPGIQAAGTLLWAAGVIEIVTGSLITIGLFTRLAAFVAAGEMAAGYWLMHGPKSLYPVVNKGEGAVLFCFVFLYLAAAGPGAWSIDRRRRIR